MWKRRLIEAFAIVTLGDGLIEFLAPTEHSRLWVVGPKSTRRIAKWFAEKPDRMRVLGPAQVVLACGWPLGSTGIFEGVRHARRHPLAIAGPRLNPITHRRASDNTVGAIRQSRFRMTVLSSVKVSIA
jgi:hypothetical protein